MRAKEFVAEAEVKPYKYNTMALDKALATLNHHCTDAIKMIHKPLWRGMRNHTQPIILLDPSTGMRKSNNTTNYYTELLDNNPHMTGWPKRSQSLICSSGYDYAEGYSGSYGALYALFPYDGVPIAVCPGKDIWYTHIKLPELGQKFESSSALSSFNSWLRSTMLLPETYAGMVKTLSDPKWATRVINTDKKKPKWSRWMTPELSEFITQPDGPKNFLSVIMDAMSPKNTGFKLMSINEFVSSAPNNRECWVGGPVVAIREDIFKAFRSAVNSGDEPAQTTVAPATVNDKGAKKSVPALAGQRSMTKKEYFAPPKSRK